MTLETLPIRQATSEIENVKAIVIDPQQQTFETVDIAGVEDIVRIVGFDTLESDAIGDAGDRLYFDEECFLRRTEGRFQIDSVIPVAGKGVVIGSDGDTLRDVAVSIDDLRTRTRFQ